MTPGSVTHLAALFMASQPLPPTLPAELQSDSVRHPLPLGSELRVQGLNLLTEEDFIPLHYSCPPREEHPCQEGLLAVNWAQIHNQGPAATVHEPLSCTLGETQATELTNQGSAIWTDRTVRMCVLMCTTGAARVWGGCSLCGSRCRLQLSRGRGHGRWRRQAARFCWVKSAVPHPKLRTPVVLNRQQQTQLTLFFFLF